MKIIKQTISLFEKSDKVKLFGVFLLMISSGFLEMVGIGLIFPFISLITKPELMEQNMILKFLYETLPISSFTGFVIVMGLLLVMIIVIKNIYALISIYIQQNFLISKRIDFTNRMFLGYMHKPYEFHLNSNSALLLRDLNSVDHVFQSMLIPFFGLVTEIIVISFLLGLLFYSNIYITLGAIMFIGLPAFGIHFFLSPKIQKIGREVFDYIGITSKLLLESLGGVKEIIILGRKSFFSKGLIDNSLILNKYRRDQFVFGLVPNLIIEVIIISSIVIIVIITLMQGELIIDVLPILSLFAATSLRIRVSVTKLITGFQQLDFSKVLGDTIILQLKQFTDQKQKNELEIPPDKLKHKTSFKSDIKLNDISFRYKVANKDAVKNISLSIRKGQSVAFVGSTGAGKSTIVDIILGLLVPQQGQILVDNCELEKCRDQWLRNIGYVPQSIYLTDDSLRNNVAFGIPEKLIDDDAVQQAISSAQLESFVNHLPKGLDTIVGERGARVSGGEKQRVAIARALYHDPDVLVFDEATSSLDSETEREIVDAIERLAGKRTIITVAHRLSTIKNHDRIYFLKDGSINDHGKFDDLIAMNSAFRSMATVQSGKQATKVLQDG